MNEYEIALELIKESYAEGEFQYDYDEIYTIKELVEKATPKKPIYSDFEEDDDGEVVIANKAKCPTCGYEFEFGTWNDHENHHCVCGQRLDWGDYE